MEFPEIIKQKLQGFRPTRKHWILLCSLVLLLGIAVASILLWQSESPRTARYEALSEAEIAATRLSAPSVSAEREAVVGAALSLLGKVHYFWGGKSAAIGWDEAWGELREVSSAGSSTTGALKPYGLDCSGFVSWCFLQLGISFSEMEDRVGNGTWNQWDRTEKIKWKELRVGDVVFQNEYPTDQGNHIGICIGFDTDGNPLFVHCAAAFDNVVVTNAGDVFKYARRPMFYNE